MQSSISQQENQINKIINDEYILKYNDTNVFKFMGPSAGGISWNGISTKILKSAVQKYIRRGIFDKAIWCINECDLFHEIIFRNPDDPKTKFIPGFITNMRNRLMIISQEDIGIGNPSLPNYINNCISQFETYRKNPAMTAERRALWYNMILNLCNSPKSREISHIKATYYMALKDNNMKYINKYPEIYNFNRTIDPNMDILGYFKHDFNNNKDYCFYWFFMDLYKTSSPIASNVTKYAEYVILQEMDLRRQNIMKILFSWFKSATYKEFWIYAAQIILLGLRKPNMDMGLSDDNKYQPYYLKNILNNKIDIDSYVMDIHVTNSPIEQQTPEFFAKEGAYVTNESPYTTPIYKEIYIQCKVDESTNIGSKKIRKPKFNANNITKLSKQSTININPNMNIQNLINDILTTMNKPTIIPNLQNPINNIPILDNISIDNSTTNIVNNIPINNLTTNIVNNIPINNITTNIPTNIPINNTTTNNTTTNTPINNTTTNTVNNNIYIIPLPKNTDKLCKVILKTGNFIGDECGNKAKYELLGQYYCGTHIKPYLNKYPIKTIDQKIQSANEHIVSSPSVIENLISPPSSPNISPRRNHIDTSSINTDILENIRVNPVALNSEIISNSRTMKISSSDLLDLFNNAPRGQKMTGANKKQTLLPTSGKYVGYVIKGPWETQSEMIRLKVMQCRLNVLKFMGGWILPFKILNGEDGRFYTIYKNLSTVNPNSWIYQTYREKYAYNPITYKQGDEKGMNVKIIIRENIGTTQLQDVNLYEKNNIIFGPQFMFHDILLMNLLQSGDIGMWNILTFIDGDIRRGVIIDYEDNRSNITYTQIDNLFNKTSASNKSLLENGIRNNKDTVLSAIKNIENKLPDIKNILNECKYSTLVPGYNIDKLWKDIKELIMKYI